MGNKHGKQGRGSNATKGKHGDDARGAPAAKDVPPPPPLHPVLESKLSHLDVTTVFTQQEIHALRKNLSALLGLQENDQIVIPKDEFIRFLGAAPTSLYVNRLYAIFDMHGKGYVSFDDLMRGLAVLSQKASREQKLMLSFHLLDPEGKGYITKSMTTELLKSCLAECKAELEIELTDAQISRIVDSTFEEADLDKNNLVDLKEYQALDAKHPGLFDFLTVDAFGVLNHLEKVRSMNVVASD
ncbi:TPA: hypothetical protein N0F65_002414 [Lagenidium giganteum]|uniref:EF-hand domain-containing protein n=1 Tax=Lagenidium giganteum TaxID=4803 RepID=A0AAV2YKZ6_9STRA|nr:TPA: hypothetical protein N0F65_002414 [Lagenidium giganteum]